MLFVLGCMLCDSVVVQNVCLSEKMELLPLKEYFVLYPMYVQYECNLRSNSSNVLGICKIDFEFGMHRIE